MRCKRCKKTQRTRKPRHCWTSAQECALCHYGMAGVSGKSYIKSAKFV
jgi:hypothetical protein